MTFIGRYNTHYVMLMDTVTACKSGTRGMTAYFYTPVVWESKELVDTAIRERRVNASFHTI